MNFPLPPFEDFKTSPRVIAWLNLLLLWGEQVDGLSARVSALELAVNSIEARVTALEGP